MARGPLLLLLALAVACGHDAPAPAGAAGAGERFTGSLSPPPPPGPGAEVVATVDGERIYAADVARQMAARGQTARAALAELIDAELLAAEARRRGLIDDPEAIEARKREAVRRFMQREFEPSFDGPEDVPQAEVEAVYKLPRIHDYYEHDEYHTAAYVRAPVPKTAGEREDAAARALAQRFHDLAVAARPATKEEFFAVAGKLPAGSGLEVAGNQSYSTTRRGPAVKAFADAAFALSRKGDLSPPVRTPWGWDVLFLEEIIPARHAPRDEAFADIRVKRFEASRRIAFQRWVDTLAAGKAVQRNDALLDAVQVDSLVGL